MTYRDPRVEDSIARIRSTMKAGGIGSSRLASELGVSRQYLWQIVHHRVHLSLERAQQIELALDRLVSESRRENTLGERLRAARRSAGFTLKQVASMIGYSWAGVERWEKNLCRPKPGVLWHLMSIYDRHAALPEESAPIRRATTRPIPAQALVSAGTRGAAGDFHFPLNTRVQAHSPLGRQEFNATTLGIAPRRGVTAAPDPGRLRRTL